MIEEEWLLNYFPEARIMATEETTAHQPYLKPIDPDTLRRSNAEMVAILDDWEENGDEQEQRETMAVLREALGPNRTISDRSAFKP